MNDASQATEEHRLRLRHLRHEDHADIKASMDRIYTGALDGGWTREQFMAQLARFPEGQICIEDHGRVVAAAMTLIVDYEQYGDQHSYAEITADGFFTTHDPDGDVLYGAEVFVDPDYRDMRLGRRLYDTRKELCRKLGLRAIIAGARIPGYAEYAGKMAPEEYLELVRRRELRDPILSFQLANDFHVRRVIRGYLPEDKASHGYATIVQWNNIFYMQQRAKLIGGRKPIVRLGTVQWQMRTMRTVDELMQQVEFFVDALAGYQSDFALFPEFFNAPLMGQFDQSNPAEAMRELAQFTDEICERMQQLAVGYNINIIYRLRRLRNEGSVRNFRDRRLDLYRIQWLCAENND